jgi:hypothetical protein
MRSLKTVPNVHPDDLLFFTEVRTAMFRVAKKYELALRNVDHYAKPESGKVFYGQCNSSGDILLTIRPTFNGVWADAPLSPESVWDTAAHELAHLKHMNHGEEFREFYEELKRAINNQQEDHREKVLRKLVKMQAQRQSEAEIGNTAAAEAFASAINRMLIEHELNPNDIDYARTADNDPVIELRVDLVKYGIDKVKRRTAWQESLARIVAKAHLCSFLLRPGSNSIWFVGTKSHATVAEYVYGTLVPAAAKMAHKEYCDYWWDCRDRLGNSKLAGGFKGAWLDAFVQRIAERFEEARAAAVKEADATLPVGSNSTALVRLNGALVRVNKYIDDKFKSKSAASSLKYNASANSEGSRRGRAAADKMVIGRRGVTGGSSPRGLLS